jgi:transposase
MAMADRSGLPIAVHLAPAPAHEVTLVADTLASRFVQATPQRLIGDRAYDSDPLDEWLRQQGIEMIAPHRHNRTKPASQDRRCLRRYRRRWKVERLNAWFQNSRRLVMRYERLAENFLAFVHLACIVILLNHF